MRVMFPLIVIQGEYFPRTGYNHGCLIGGYWRLQPGVRFDVLDIGLFHAANSVHFDAESVVSDVTGDRAGIPMTTATRSRGCDSGLSGWLNFVSQGAEPIGSSN